MIFHGAVGRTCEVLRTGAGIVKKVRALPRSTSTHKIGACLWFARGQRRFFMLEIVVPPPVGGSLRDGGDGVFAAFPSTNYCSEQKVHVLVSRCVNRFRRVFCLRCRMPLYALLWRPESIILWPKRATFSNLLIRRYRARRKPNKVILIAHVGTTMTNGLSMFSRYCPCTVED